MNFGDRGKKNPLTRPSDESTSRVAISEDIQKAVLNCYEYFCNNGKRYGVLYETAKALKLCKRSVERIVERREVRASKEENMKEKLTLER